MDSPVDADDSLGLGAPCFGDVSPIGRIVWVAATTEGDDKTAGKVRCGPGNHDPRGCRLPSRTVEGGGMDPDVPHD